MLLYIPCTTCLHILLAHSCLYYYLLSLQYTVLHILFYCTFYSSLFFILLFYFYLYLCIFSCVVLHLIALSIEQTWPDLHFTADYILYNRDAPVDRPKIGTGRFLLIMRDRQPAGFCLFFGRFFRKCEHVICVEDIRQKHNTHRKTDTMKRTAVGVTLLAHK